MEEPRLEALLARRGKGIRLSRPLHRRGRRRIRTGYRRPPDKYRVRIEGVRDQLAVSDRRVADLEADIAASRQGEVFSGVGDVLGAVLGGRSRNTISRAATRRSQTRQIEARRQKAEGTKAARLDDLAVLENELAADIIEITSEWDDRAALIEEIEIPLERVDVQVIDMKLVWVPY